MTHKQIIHSTYVIDIPARKVKRGDIDTDFDTMRDNMKPSVEIQIEDCKLALKKYIRVSASKTAGYSIVEFAKVRVTEHLAELKRLCALPKQPKAPDGKLPLVTIKRLLEADKLHAMHIANNQKMLDKLHSFGSITRTSHGGYCANVEHFAPKKQRLTLKSISEHLLSSDYTPSLLQAIYPQDKQFVEGDTVQVNDMPMVYSITEIVALNGVSWYKLQNSTGRQLSARKASALRKVAQ